MNKNITEAYGFIYKTINLVNRKQYIGQCSLHRRCWKSYLGSGKALKRAIKKYGRENFERSILCYCFNKEDMNVIEEQIIEDYDAANDRNFYNIISKATATNGFSGKSHTEEWKALASDFGKTRPATERMKENMRRVGKLPKSKTQLSASKINAKNMGHRNAKPKILKAHQCPVCKIEFSVLEYTHHSLDDSRTCGVKCGAVIALKSRKNIKKVIINNKIFDNAKLAAKELNINYHTLRRRLISDKFIDYQYKVENNE